MIPDSNPIILIQNRLHPILNHTGERVALYRQLLKGRLARVDDEVAWLKIPHLRGLRLRLPGKPFHSTPEIFFQEGGQTHFELPHETVALGPGEVMLVPARMPHGERWTGSSFLNLIVSFHAESVSLHFGYREQGKGPLRCGPIDRFTSINRFATLAYAEEMAEVPGKDVVSRRLRQGLYVAFLARLIQGLLPSRHTASPQNDWVARCSEMIEVYFSKMDFSVAWLAREMGCSADHASRRFRTHTGQRIMEVVHRRRIDHARRLLHDSDMNVAEIAWTCGFSQPSYFNRVFRMVTGTTPKDFRRGANGVR